MGVIEFTLSSIKNYKKVGVKSTKICLYSQRDYFNDDKQNSNVEMGPLIMKIIINLCLMAFSYVLTQ